MKEGIVYTGIPSGEELANCPGRPTKERMEKGRVAVIECVQEIPCNPCEAACRFGAISIGENITSLPCLDGDRCTGCGMCITQCPGLAIVVINKNYSEKEASIDFPFEYLPLPKVGDRVQAVGRDGQPVCEGIILKVTKAEAFEGTCVVSMTVPREYIDTVRSMKRLPAEQKEA